MSFNTCVLSFGVTSGGGLNEPSTTPLEFVFRSLSSSASAQANEADPSGKDWTVCSPAHLSSNQRGCKDRPRGKKERAP
jgi:hypothetical protein